MKKILLPLLLISFGFFISCHRGTEMQNGQSGPQDTLSGTLTITMEQFHSAGMKVGDPDTLQFSNLVKVNGYVTPTI